MCFAFLLHPPGQDQHYSKAQEIASGIIDLFSRANPLWGRKAQTIRFQRAYAKKVLDERLPLRHPLTKSD